MNRIWRYRVVLPLLAGGFASCAPVEDEIPHTLAYEVPVSSGALQSLAFNPNVTVGGSFTFKDSPCDPFTIEGDKENGFSLVTAWDPYTCAEDPANPPEDEGNLQVYIDGHWFGSYGDVTEISFAPKTTLVFYLEAGEIDAATDPLDEEGLPNPDDVTALQDPNNDLNNDGVLTNDYYAVCNYYFPDGPQGYQAAIVEQAATAIGGYVNLFSANDDTLAGVPDLSGQIDYNTWFWNLSYQAGFSYVVDAVADGGQGHFFQANLAYDTHSTIYGGVGERVLFDTFPTAELDAWDDPNGLPWCGSVSLFGGAVVPGSTPYML